MLDDLTVYEAKNVGQRQPRLTCLQNEVCVSDNQVPFRDDTLYIEMHVRVGTPQRMDEGDERFRTIGGVTAFPPCL